jgi:hypothetical protein
VYGLVENKSEATYTALLHPDKAEVQRTEIIFHDAEIAIYNFEGAVANQQRLVRV